MIFAFTCHALPCSLSMLPQDLGPMAGVHLLGGLSSLSRLTQLTLVRLF